MNTDTRIPNLPDHLRNGLDLQLDPRKSRFQTHLRTKIRDRTLTRILTDIERHDLNSILKLSLQMVGAVRA